MYRYNEIRKCISLSEKMGKARDHKLEATMVNEVGNY